MSLTTKGSTLKKYVSLVKNEKGSEGINQLMKIMGNIDFDSSKLYPIEVENSLIENTTEVIYGNKNPESLTAFGELVLKNSFINSTLGKIILSFAKAKTIKDSIVRMPQYLEKQNRDLGYELNISEFEIGELKINVKSDYYNIDFLFGMIKGMTKYFGYLGDYKKEIINQKEHNYYIKIKEN